VKLVIARSTPVEQRATASKIRGLAKPDVEVRFLFMKCARLILAQIQPPHFSLSPAEDSVKGRVIAGTRQD
jgi:hypothetical protein